MTKKRELAGKIPSTTVTLEDTSSSIAIFLQKTFDMIESTSDAILTWSSNGHSFVIKQPKELARTILPKYFKHEKFSSFVRQLNFYGFHKSKNEDILVSTEEANNRKNWWEFHHENFRRDEKELMRHIKRKTYSDNNQPAQDHEVAFLQTRVKDLETQINSMQGQMNKMMGVVKYLSKRYVSSQSESHTRILQSETSYKKRKLFTSNSQKDAGLNLFSKKTDDSPSEWSTDSSEDMDWIEYPSQIRQLPEEELSDLDQLDELFVDDDLIGSRSLKSSQDCLYTTGSQESLKFPMF